MFQVGSKEPGRRNNHPEGRKSSRLRSYKVSCSPPPSHIVFIAFLDPLLPSWSLPCCLRDLFKTQIHHAIPLLANRTRSNWLCCLQDEILISWQIGIWVSVTPPDVPLATVELHHHSARLAGLSMQSPLCIFIPRELTPLLPPPWSLPRLLRQSKFVALCPTSASLYSSPWPEHPIFSLIAFVHKPISSLDCKFAMASIALFLFL